jgi:hypothetical protein
VNGVTGWPFPGKEQGAVGESVPGILPKSHGFSDQSTMPKGFDATL